MRQLVANHLIVQINDPLPLYFDNSHGEVRDTFYFLFWNLLILLDLKIILIQILVLKL